MRFLIVVLECILVFSPVSTLQEYTVLCYIYSAGKISLHFKVLSILKIPLIMKAKNKCVLSACLILFFLFVCFGD